MVFGNEVKNLQAAAYNGAIYIGRNQNSINNIA